VSGDSNKDLGRVLALAWLAERRVEGTLVIWGDLWLDALQARFPDRWREFALKAGRGLRELLSQEREADFEEAYQTCGYGLLASQPPTPTALRIAGERLIVEAIEPLEAAARVPRPT
jgi:hypothetical protein